MLLSSDICHKKAKFSEDKKLVPEYFNPFAPELPVTARADPGPFYPL